MFDLDLTSGAGAGAGTGRRSKFLKRAQHAISLQWWLINFVCLFLVYY
jgi:hypothetical protein